MADQEYIKGRGAQFNTPNPYLDAGYEAEHVEGLDTPMLENSPTEIIRDQSKKILNKVTSPDIPAEWSMNPYQGCEHGCIYCYARNTHQYWGLSAGLDFERKIIIKENAAALLEKQLRHPKWKASPIMLSGNTDCYQPLERQLGLTRNLLEVCVRYRHPVGIITKSSLVLRDLDLLRDLAEEDLVHVAVSITTLDEALRRKLEPRTASSQNRLKVVKVLSENGIPVNVMAAPMIPGLSSHEIPAILKAAAENGALEAGYIVVRLNGNVAPLFEDWISKNYPDRADKVMSQIKECHGGKLNDSRQGLRMKGEGNIAASINRLFRVSKEKYFAGRSMPAFNLKAFRKLDRGGQLGLFQG